MNAEVSSTTGMAANYSDNSTFQQDSASAALPDIAAYVTAVLGRNHDPGFTVVDFGTGPGTSGLPLFRSIIDEVRRADPGRDITVVHQDLPGNAWGDLVARLREDPASYLNSANPPPVLAAVGSFYRRTMPPSSIHFGMSFMAAHWMSVQEHPSVRSSAAVLDADAADERRIAADAAADWHAFWKCRETELAPGGALIVKCIGSLDGGSESTSLGLLRMLGGAFQAAADAGLITEASADGFVLSEYPRTEDEARAPFAAGALPTLRLDRAEVCAEPDPYRARYDVDHDAAAYAKRLTGFVRAFTETSVRWYLKRNCRNVERYPSGAGTTIDDIVDWIYRWCESSWCAKPDTDPFEAWTLTVAAHKI